MFGSAGVPKDLNFLFPVAPPDREKEEGDAPHHHHHQHQHHHHQEQQMSGGLLKYRSAPTSNLLGEVCEEFLPHRSTGPDAAAAALSMFPRFVGEPEGPRGHMGERQGEAEVAKELPCSFTQLLFHSPHRQQQHAADAQINPAANSMGLDHGKEDGGLARQSNSSSHPGLFSHLSSSENANGFSGNRLKTRISFSSRQASSGFMSQISEVSGEGGSGGSTEESHDARGFVANYPVASWEDSVLLSDCFNGGKRVRGEPLVKTPSGELRNNGSSSEFIAFQAAAPWKLRAKRGCATHPRSIAERVRRTKISERMRKLQELVPNMDKQTSTADMLDLAVDYVKDLQDQIKRLTECKANCTCTQKQSS